MRRMGKKGMILQDFGEIRENAPVNHCNTSTYDPQYLNN